jgi:hypothetical protein
MNLEAERQNGHKESLPRPRGSIKTASSGTTSSINGTSSTSLTLAGTEVSSNGTSSRSTPPPQQSPSLKKGLQHQSSHQGDSLLKGIYSYTII